MTLYPFSGGGPMPDVCDEEAALELDCFDGGFVVVWGSVVGELVGLPVSELEGSVMACADDVEEDSAAAKSSGDATAARISAAMAMSWREHTVFLSGMRPTAAAGVNLSGTAMPRWDVCCYELGLLTRVVD